MKTPDETKKGLECCLGDCHNYHCEECPYRNPDTVDYDGCPDNGRELAEDALALIQQLEAERDALIDAVKDWGGSCAVCKHYDKPEDSFPCRFCAERFPEDEDKISHWQWRGVQKEATP